MSQNSNGSSPTRRAVNLAETVEILRRSDNILVVSHLRPDGDCIGSSVALLLGLKSLGKRVAAYNRDGLGPKTNYLRGSDCIQTTMPPWQVDLTVFVDCGAVRRVADGFAPVGKTLNIDHHLTNDRFADYNFIDVDAAAVGEQVINILGALGVTITPEIASAAYLSVMSDTGGFRYSNTNAATFDLAARLVRLGADPGTASTAYYESRERGEFLLSGRAYERLKVELDGAFAWSELRSGDYDDAGGEEVEPDGLVNELRAIRGVEISLLFHEMRTGGLRGGLRGKGRIDCAEVAQRFGGGGHFNAAGLVVSDRPFEEARELVLRELRTYVAEQLAAAAP